MPAPASTPSRRPPRRRPQRPTGLVYAAVLAAALVSALLQPGRNEAPAHTAALLELASWAGGGAADALMGAASAGLPR